MRTRFRILMMSLVPALTAMGQLSTRTNAELAERHIADRQNTNAQKDAFVRLLAAAVSEEKRTNDWAARKESELRASHAAEKAIASSILRLVDCRSSKCELQMQVAGQQQPEAAIEQLILVGDWVARSQECGYTIAGGEISQPTAGTIRVFLDCGKRAQPALR
jgi:hypothetical protein